MDYLLKARVKRWEEIMSMRVVTMIGLERLAHEVKRCKWYLLNAKMVGTFSLRGLMLGCVCFFHLILNRILIFNSIKYYVIYFCSILFLLSIKK